ncbi:hypothetical protein A8U91_02573 [Halomonas elongata]|uniref:Uncharacterized protein n=1 Tax=Halomonas elongata TaxID=2746 RepID=A0A1B8P7F6_HALEL|nr:hypothetical protein [Halomonas elongata]OBX38187.1 hypothetical protein A8U91_02573 [Halomonas elongata]
MTQHVGELTRATLDDWLGAPDDARGLSHGHALLDPRQQLMVESASPGLPTTLLFDAEGRGVTQHVGELTRATLDDWLGAR